MKRILNFALCLLVGVVAFAQLPELTVEQHLEDYDFAVKYLEDNYAGFPSKVVDSTRADYESMKAKIRTRVQQGECPGWDAVAQYIAWFEDFHTRISMNDVDSAGNTRGYNERYWQRKKIHYSDYMQEYAPKPVACKVTDKTFLIRFPSCYGDVDKAWIEGSINEFKESGCENLVLDIRGNGGGSDDYFLPYWKLLYDHEGSIPGIEYRNTAEHRKMLLQQLQENGLSQEIMMGIQAVLPMTENIDYLPLSILSPVLDLANSGQSVSMQDLLGLLGQLGESSNDYSTLVFHCDEVNDAVRKAALIIDNGIASSGEQMVRQIQLTSDRTTVYGRDNTMGCLDFANLYDVEMPNCHIRFSCPMSRTMGYPKNGIDATGIAPDVRIDLPLPAKLTDNVDEWVIWVTEQLEK